MPNPAIRICLWSGPRNISTALMYAFAQRDDTLVVDEPLYAHYLTSTPARHYHPGAEAVIAAQENEGSRVINEVILGKYEKPVVFFKNMTHHLVDVDWGFLKHTVNIILTRTPLDMLPSYIKQIEQPKITDTGYPQQLELLRYLRALGQKPLVVDSSEILENPAAKLYWLCRQIGIPFTEKMLNWPAGPRKEDGVWAPYWYHNVHASTGFEPYQPREKKLPPHLLPLLKECEKLYEELVGNMG